MDSNLDLNTLNETERKLAATLGVGFPDPAALRGGDARERERAVARLNAWVEGQIEDQKGAVGDKRLHYARHRLFKQGRQWISSRTAGKWREMGNPNNRIRAVFNMVGPALDFRLSVLEEQQPGFATEPVPGGGVDGRERAEAQQALVEYHFKRDQIWQLTRHASTEAQTDGVAFYHVYIDRNKGPEYESTERIPPDDERFVGMKAQGYAMDGGQVVVPLGSDGKPAPAGSRGVTRNRGEICTDVIPAYYVWADPESKTPNGPLKPAKWMFVRRPRDLYSARIETGKYDLKADASANAADEMTDALDRGTRWDKGLPPFPSQRGRRDRESVFETIIYIANSPAVRGGLWLHLIGDVLVGSGKLPGGVIPLARTTDGSSDSDMFPLPVMSGWMAPQINLNASGSKIMEYGRLHSGSRLMTVKDTVITETWNTIVGSIVEYRGPKPDVLTPPKANPDLWQMFMQAYHTLEDLTGYNDIGRGKMTGDSVQGMQDVSGRAVLGVREMFERQFGPMVRAAALGVTEWAKLIVAYAQYLYETPRMIPMTGRGDLARKVSKEDIAGPCMVTMDPETLLPLPRALRQQMLWDMLQAGLIDRRTYAKRAPFAEIRNIHMGDTDQWNRAQWINTIIEERYEELYELEALELYTANEGVLVWWQDDPQIMMTALEEIILDEKKPWRARKVAADRWGIYADLQRAKSWTPDQLALGIPQPPAPYEVVGVPNSVPQGAEPMKQLVAQTHQQPPGASAQPGALASPTDAPITTAAGATARPGPAGDGLPR